MTLGNFPVNNWVTQEMWEFKMKHAIKIFMPVQTWWWSHSAPVHLAPWRVKVCQKTSRFFCFWRYHTKAPMWVNNQAISSWSLPFSRLRQSCGKMSGALLRTGWRMVVGGGLKGHGRNKTQAAQNKQSTGCTQWHHFASSYQLSLTFTSKYGKWLQMETES